MTTKLFTPESRSHDPPKRLTFSPQAWLKLQYLCHAGPTEVAAFGLAAADATLATRRRRMRLVRAIGATAALAALYRARYEGEPFVRVLGALATMAIGAVLLALGWWLARSARSARALSFMPWRISACRRSASGSTGSRGGGT